MILPVQPFDVGQVRFLSYGDATARQRREAQMGVLRGFNVWKRVAEDPNSDSWQLCDTDEPKIRRAFARWKTAQGSDPRLTYEDFIEDGGNVELPEDWDRRLPSVRLIATVSGRGVGAFSCMNMEIEFSDLSRVEANATCTGLFNPRIAEKPMRLWGVVARYIIDNDLTISDGRILDILEWRWDADPPIKDDQSYALQPIFQEIRRVGVRQTPVVGDEVSLRMRRSDAPRQRPEDEEVPRDPSLPPRS